MRAVVEPGVQRDVAFEPAEPADELAEQRERGREERRVERVRSRARPARSRARRGAARPTRPPRRGRPRSRRPRASGVESTARRSPSATAGGGSRSHTSWEWECGRLRPPAAPSFTNAWTYAKPVLSRRRRAARPRLGDRRELLRREVGERLDVPRRVDDDLLPLERRIEVRDDAHAASRACPAAPPSRPSASDSGGVCRLVALAERAVPASGPRPGGSRGAARPRRARPDERVAAQVGARSARVSSSRAGGLCARPRGTAGRARAAAAG